MDLINSSLITVVVPVYNVEKYIHRCIDSIMVQSFSEFDLVLVDDGSPDQCGEICDSYIDIFRKRGIVCKVIHQDNGGLSAARNSGIEWALNESKSEWITFIDSDDWINPDYLKLLYDAVSTYKVDIATAQYDMVKSTADCEEQLSGKAVKLMDPQSYWLSNRTNATVAWGKLYRKKCFEDVRYPVGKYHEDEYVTYKVLFKYDRIAVIEEKLYHYFFNDSSISRLNYYKRLPDILAAFSEHIEYFKDSKWKEVYRVEIEKYAEALSDGIWIGEKRNSGIVAENIVALRQQLRQYLSINKSMIPLYKRKDIYIAAYPKISYLIRIYGLLGGKYKSNFGRKHG